MPYNMKMKYFKSVIVNVLILFFLSPINLLVASTDPFQKQPVNKYITHSKLPANNVIRYQSQLRPDSDKSKLSIISPDYQKIVNKENQDKTPLSIYTRAINEQPEIADMVYINRGNTFFALNNLVKARKDYSSAIKVNPKYDVAYYNRGLMNYLLGDYVKSFLDYKKAIKLNPSIELAHNNIGLINHKKGKYHKAIDSFSKELKINPNNLDYYICSNKTYDGNQLISSNFYFLEPKYGVTYYNCGNSFYELGNYSKAIVNYNRAIKLEPNLSFSASYNMAISYLVLKKYKQSIISFNNVIKINPKYIQAYTYRGTAFYRLGDIAKACKDAKIAVKLGSFVLIDALKEKGYCKK